MLELNLYPITGLYQEVYNPDLLSMSEPLGAESGIDVFRNINSYFWSNVLSEKTIVSKISSFKKNKNELISLKKQPYNLWVSLKFKNINPNKLYWLSIYSQADTIVCYEKKSCLNHFVLKKLSGFIIFRLIYKMKLQKYCCL